MLNKNAVVVTAVATVLSEKIDRQYNIFKNLQPSMFFFFILKCK